jgi:predicted DNA-binding protein (MmcQ/YjbR family)
MTLEKLGKYCLSYPGATEQIQWDADLVFQVGGSMLRSR